MRNSLKKIISTLCLGTILVTSQLMPAYAIDNQVETTKFNYNFEQTVPLDDETFNSKIGNSIILAEGVEQIELEEVPDGNSINAKDSTSRKVYIVDVSWRVAYNSSDGLCFSTTATSRDSRCRIIALRGLNSYQATNSYASGSVGINTRGSAAIKMHNFGATNRFFSSGTRFKCTINLDVDATHEISGGAFSKTVYVTIP